MSKIPRLIAETSTLIVVDVQDKLLAAMPTAASLVKNISFLLDVANLLAIPTRATEQYPKGLGPTNAEITKRIHSTIPPKTKFSCCGAAGFLTDLQSLNRPNIVLVGMEAHVCVSQTTFDFIEAGFTVFVPVDAVASRFEIDSQTAVHRLDHCGAILTTAEAVAFEWVGDAAHPSFKSVSRLVIEKGRQ